MKGPPESPKQADLPGVLAQMNLLKLISLEALIRDHSHITFIQRRVGGSAKIWQLHNGMGGWGTKNMMDNAFTTGIYRKLQSTPTLFTNLCNIDF